MTKKTNNGDVLDNVKPQSLEEATGTALAVRNPAAEELAEYPDEETGGYGMSGFTATPHLTTRDFQMPQLKLAQGLTREVQDSEAKVGQWLVPGSEPMDVVTIIPIAMQLGREYRDKTEGGKLLCHSDDRILGIGEPGGDCNTCPLSKWTDAISKDGSVRHVPPPCQETYRYIVYVEESDSLAMLSFKSQAYKVGKKLNTFVQSKGMGRFAIKLSASREVGQRGTYALPVIAFTKVDSSLFDRARELSS